MNGLIIGIILISIFLIYSSIKKGSTKMKKPNNIKSFKTNIPFDKAMKTIIQYAQSNGYKVDDFNEAESIIILSDSASLTSYGNIYPIYLINQSDSSILIEVGIKSKSFQVVGLEALHERCFKGIKTAIYAVS